MKKIFTIIIALFSIISLSAQTYPQYLIKNGDTVGIIFSIEQAQKIDNDYEILEILRKSKMQSDKIDSAYIIVINNLGVQVAELKLKVSTLEGLNSDKDSQINNLKNQISKYERDAFLANQQSLKKDTIISNNNKEIKKLKRQKFFGFTFGGGGLISIIVLLLLYY